MKYQKIILLSFLLGLLSPVTARETENSLSVNDALDYCHHQVKRALKELSDDGRYEFSKEPRNILANDRQKGWNLRPATAEEWCSGFWPGILWMDYMVSKDTSLLRVARGYTESLQPIVNRPVYDHDLGFLINCSYGKGYAVTGDANYKKVLLRAADSLATLFNPVVGTMLSWPREVKRQGWPHNTIMDNMMNLELLFWASRNGGNPLLYDLAVAHAKTTMQHQFRPDGTCYHVAVYDTITGNFIKGVTHQGWSDASTWSRGQAWAIYGYTVVYRYTHNPMFLKFAEKVTDIYMEKLRKTSDDLIPSWDMDAPDRQVKDASAACVIASALLELQGYVEPSKQRTYREFALQSLAELCTDKYLSGKKNVSFLLHST
ncbi:MAG: glycoside hydrolase family 88 protein, partial [Prevotella sp.]